MTNFEAAYEIIPAQGWLTKEEASFLWFNLKRVGPSVLEVGSYCGRSTCLIALAGKCVFSVDPFEGFDSTFPSGDEIERTFWLNIKSRGLQKQVIQLRKKVEDFDNLITSVDLAYLDGDHTYQGTKNQISAALRNKAGVIMIHDVNDSGDGAEVKRAAIEMLGPFKERIGRLASWEVRYEEHRRTR